MGRHAARFCCSAVLNRDGGFQSVEVKGDMFLTVSDSSCASIRVCGPRARNVPGGCSGRCCRRRHAAAQHSGCMQRMSTPLNSSNVW